MGYITVAVAPELFLPQVLVTPLLSSTPCNMAETKVLEEEYPEAFPVCTVTRSQAQAPIESTTGNNAVVEAPVVKMKRESDSSPVDLADIAFATWWVMSELPVLNRDTLIAAQTQDHTLSPLRQRACTAEEVEKVAEGCYFKGGVLMKKWRPPTCPATDDWRT